MRIAIAIYYEIEQDLEAKIYESYDRMKTEGLIEETY